MAVQQGTAVDLGTGKNASFTAVGNGPWVDGLLGSINWFTQGTFVAEVAVEMSRDGGTTAVRVRDMAGNEVRARDARGGTIINNEPGVLFRFVCLSFTSGQVDTRLSCGPVSF